MAKITATLLRKLGACENQVEVFKKHWPRGAQITLANVKKAQKLGLDCSIKSDTGQ